MRGVWAGRSVVARGRALAVCLTTAALLLVSFAALAEPNERKHELGIQGGWWNAEVDYVTNFGLQINLGWPWGAYVQRGSPISNAYYEQGWFVPLEAKLGYQFDFPRNDVVTLRVGFRGAMTWSQTDYFGGGWDHMKEDCESIEFDFLGTLEVGLRFRFKFGLVLGLEIPIFAFLVLEQDDCDPMCVHDGPRFPFAYSQIYLGWSWKL